MNLTENNPSLYFLRYFTEENLRIHKKIEPMWKTFSSFLANTLFCIQHLTLMLVTWYLMHLVSFIPKCDLYTSRDKYASSTTLVSQSKHIGQKKTGTFTVLSCLTWPSWASSIQCSLSASSRCIRCWYPSSWDIRLSWLSVQLNSVRRLCTAVEYGTESGAVCGEERY